MEKGMISWGWLNVDCLNKIKKQKKKTQKKIENKRKDSRKIKEMTQRSRVVTPHNIVKRMNWLSCLSVVN